MYTSSKNGCEIRWGKGFTLIEILFAITIFAVLAITVYGSLNAVLSKNSAIKEGSAVYEMAGTTLNRITMDLTATFAEQYPEYQVPGTNDPPDPYRFLGDEIFLKGSAFSQLRFASNEYLGISSESQSGLARILYYTGRSGDREEESIVLRRSETPFPYDIDEDPSFFRSHGGSDDPVICKDVESFTLTYVDENGREHNEWDSDAERFAFATPRAVIVELAVSGENRTHEFSTRIDIPVYRKGLKDVRR